MPRIRSFHRECNAEAKDMSSHMNPPDPSLPQTEDQIPLLAAIAVERAFRHALDAGLVVMIADSGIIFEEFPDGSRREFKRIPPNVPVTCGQIIRLQ